MNYGYFDDHAREYVITNPKTPVKWINYIGTLDFGGFVDHTGGALLCRHDPALNRLTRYVAQMPASDFKGTTLYLRIKTKSGYRLFSPFYVPCLVEPEQFACHVGLGYTRIVSEWAGVRSDVTIFVPPGASCELRDIRLTNIGRQAVELDAIPVVEYTHPDALKQFTNADWVPQTMQSQVINHGQYCALIQYPFMNRDRQVNYFTSNGPVSSFETDRRRFLGDNEYGTWANPLSLRQTELSNNLALRGDNIAALLHHLGVLQPGETRRLVTQLGQAQLGQAQDDEPGAFHTANFWSFLDAYRDEARVTQALEQVNAYWEDYLSRLQVETPDADMNRMINVYTPRQCHTTKNWSRYLSLYQLGYGARGIGFRDSSQDVMSVLAAMPDESKALIRQLLHVQKCNGSAMHQFNPLTMAASEGDAREMEDRPHYYGDDHLWIVLATTAYLKETGDFSFLQDVLPFYDKDKHGQALETENVLEHLRRAIEFTAHDLGAHGLPLLGFADWNDTVNLARGAESLFVANLYGKALLEMIDLMRYLGDTAGAMCYEGYYAAMRERVNATAWDGAWYIRYFDADGSPLGSQRNSHGQIYTNGQSWPVISGFATPERARLALDAVYQRLNTRYGIKLSMPGFNGYDPSKGGITTYPPGAKENGGIFLHANPWVVIAETLVGRGERAFEYYRQINPAARNNEAEVFECEPYVYPQNILGDEHPLFGLARNSWLSGSASWMYQAGVQYILGIQPTYDGLRINPCIPPAWDGFKARRVFRRAVYDIQVTNPDHVSHGVKSMHVDGRLSVGQVAPVLSEGEAHQVHIVMGG